MASCRRTACILLAATAQKTVNLVPSYDHLPQPYSLSQSVHWVIRASSGS